MDRVVPPLKSSNGDHFPLSQQYKIHGSNTVTDLIKALPGNSSVNTVQHATIEEAVFSVDPTDAPIVWLDSDHVIYLLYVHVRSAAI
jgi:hypothetical protein